MKDRDLTGKFLNELTEDDLNYLMEVDPEVYEHVIHEDPEFVDDCYLVKAKDGGYYRAYLN